MATRLRNMTQEKTKGMQCDQDGDQLRNMTQEQTKGKQCDQDGDQVRNMTGTHARLYDKSGGNCPVR